MVGAVVDHPRKRTWVGESTVYTILGSWVAPWFVDAYLARKGISGQQTDQPASTTAGDHLDAPVPADRGSHGEFDDTAWSTSPLVLLQQHRHAVDGVAAAALALGAITGAVGVVLALARRSAA